MWRACCGVVRLALIASVFVAGPFNPVGDGFGLQFAAAGQDSRPGKWKSTPGHSKRGGDFSSPIPDVVDFLNRALDGVFGEPRRRERSYDPGEAANARSREDPYRQPVRGPAGPETMTLAPLPRPAGNLSAGEEEWLIAAATAPAPPNAAAPLLRDLRSAVVVDAVIADPAVTARSAPDVAPGAATAVAFGDGVVTNGIGIPPSSAAAPVETIAVAQSETGAGAASPVGTAERPTGAATVAGAGELAHLLIEPVVRAAVVAAIAAGLVAGKLSGIMQGVEQDELATIALYTLVALLAATAALRIAGKRLRTVPGAVSVTVPSNRIRWRLVRLRGRTAGVVFGGCRRIAAAVSAALRATNAVTRLFGAGMAKQFRAACAFVQFRLLPATGVAFAVLAGVLSDKVLPAAWNAASAAASILFLRVIPAVRDRVIWPAGVAASQLLAMAWVQIVRLAEAGVALRRRRHAPPSEPAQGLPTRLPVQKPRLSEDEVLRAIRETIDRLAAESRARQASSLTDGTPEVSR